MASEFAVYIGDIDNPSFAFNNSTIRSISADNSVDLIGRELCADTVEITVDYTEVDGELRALTWATPIYLYADGRMDAKYYITDVSRIGVSVFRIRGTSAVGILEYETYYGKIYSGETFKSCVEEIIGTNGLMPYDGYYTKFTRIISGGSPPVGTAPIYLGMSAYQDLRSSGAGNGAFNTATMSSKMSAKVQIHPFHGDDSDGNTRCMVPIIGAVENIYSGTIPDISVLRHQYGLYMDMRRDSTSVPWPDYGIVRFAYELNDFPVGTPASEADAVYEIDVDPVAGTVTINGNTESFSSPYYPNDLCPLHSILGVSLLYSSSSGLYHSNMIAQTQCDITVEKYEIRSQTDELQFRGVMLKDLYTGGLCGFDPVNKIFNKGNQVTNYQTTLDLSSFEQYDTPVYGNFPAFRSRTALQTDVLANIAFSPSVENLPVYGWLPVCSKREALHQVLLALGVILVKDDAGSLLFTAPIAEQSGVISIDDIYNSGSEGKIEHVNTVTVTEHTFIYDSGASAETVYENNSASLGEYYIAMFNGAPIYGTPTASGMEVIASNCNAAIVSGNGTLVAVKYIHEKTERMQSIFDYPDGKDVTVSDATLVVTQNSAALMSRLVNYYSNAYTSTISIKQNAERCGLFYGAFNAFGDAISGFIASASKIFSSFIKATCKVICGYTPPAFTGFSNYVILTGSGTWMPTDGVTKIRAVLIGGGQGGASGYAGKDGVKPARGSYSSNVADGGYGGDPGDGGKVFEIDIDNPSATYTYNCGQGGAGGAISTSKSVNNAGTSGSDTIFSDGVDSYSSASGSVRENGITNFFTGEMYAKKFEAGIADYDAYGSRGRRGAPGGFFYGDSSRTYDLAPGGLGTDLVLPPYTWYDGGKAGTKKGDSSGFFALGGAGGGAAAGSNGSKGGNATLSSGTYHGGKGGKGADATYVPPKATDYNPKYYGYGGCGGYGGGGGGSGGLASSGVSSATGAGGDGGYGGVGGDGGDGCVLIYY